VAAVGELSELGVNIRLRLPATGGPPLYAGRRLDLPFALLDTELRPGQVLTLSCDERWMEPDETCQELTDADPDHADCCYTQASRVKPRCSLDMFYWPDAPFVCSSMPSVPVCTPPLLCPPGIAGPVP
jgi:hypothetical protein